MSENASSKGKLPVYQDLELGLEPELGPSVQKKPPVYKLEANQDLKQGLKPEEPIPKPTPVYRPEIRRPPTPPRSMRQERKARSQWDPEKQSRMVQPTKTIGARIADRAAIVMLLSFAASIMLVGFLSSFKSLN